MQRKNYVKKEYCRPELSVIPVSTEPIMGTNSPFKSDHEKAGDDDTNTYDGSVLKLSCKPILLSA